MILEPWPHIIIDDFLPEEEFILLSEHCERSFKNLPERIHSSYDDQVQRWHLNYDPIAHHDMSQYLKFFDHREYSTLRNFVNYAKTTPYFVHKMHVEAPFKILSSVLYLGPKENNGTRLYSAGPERGEVIESEWKLNRMLIFAGHDDVTWHDYTSSSEDRYTFNHYLVDSEVIENELYQSLHFKIH